MVDNDGETQKATRDEAGQLIDPDLHRLAEPQPSRQPYANPARQPPVNPELPQYRCYKVVRALQIGAVEVVAGYGEGVIAPVDDRFRPFLVTADYMKKHDPQAGGYYVLYEDGYKSFSPKEAFEAGYTRLSDFGQGRSTGS